METHTDSYQIDNGVLGYKHTTALQYLYKAGPPITDNRSLQLDTRPHTGITSDEYDRLIRGMY
jgi:hypothetical protein